MVVSVKYILYGSIVSHVIAAVYCKAGVLISQDQDLSHTTLDDLHKQGHVKDVFVTASHLSSVQSWKEAVELYVIALVHKQMYWIRTSLRRFQLQPSNVKCNI